jgi:membrane protease subunit HflK
MSINDPEWGRNPNNQAPNGQTPSNQGSGQSTSGGDDSQPRPQQGRPRRPGNDDAPDLDALWQDFNQKLNDLFGQKGKRKASKTPFGGGFGGGQSGPSANRLVSMVLGAAFLFWLSTGFFIVQEGNEAVVLQFGKYHHTAPAGFQWRLPSPIQSHEVVNSSQVRIIEVGYRNEVKTKILKESLMLTEDENIIDIQFAVQYRLKNASSYLFNTVDPDDTVKMAAENAIREVVGGRKMDFVLYEGREAVAQNTAQAVQQILDRYNTGVLVTSVTVQNVQPPEQVQASFDDAVKAGQDRERLKNDGQAYANDVIPRARGQAARLKEESQGYRERVVAQAQGDAARFGAVLAEYDKAPKVTRERMYIDTMQEVYSNVTKVLVDSKSNSQLLYLPLDKLMEKTAPSNNSINTGASPNSSANRGAPKTV